MARPVRCRRICFEPEYNRFASCGRKCYRANYAAETAGEREDDRIMKVAVTYGNKIEEGKIAGAQVVGTDGIGAGAQTALAEAGIRLYGGVSGSTDEAVEALLAGNLAFDPDVHCSHHGEGHHHGNSCCGEAKHDCAGNGGGC